MRNSERNRLVEAHLQVLQNAKLQVEARLLSCKAQHESYSRAYLKGLGDAKKEFNRVINSLIDR